MNPPRLAPNAVRPPITTHAPEVTGVMAGGFGSLLALLVAVVEVTSSGVVASTPRKTRTIAPLALAPLAKVLTVMLVGGLAPAKK